MHLTIEEVSSLLNLPLGTVQRWIRQGKIPVYSFEGEYVFLEKDLRKWAKSRHIVLSSKSTGTAHQNANQKCRLVAALQRGGVLRGVAGDDISSILKGLVESAPLDHAIDRDELFIRLIEREELSTTGIGRGIAIPHPRSPLENAPAEPCITTCFLDRPVDYGAIDRLPVFVLFLMLSPSPDIHLMLLAKLSHLLRRPSFLDLLKSRPSDEELLAIADEMETEMDTAHRSSKPEDVF
jgi:PTS system nitrogen regulatory IIA component